MEPKQRRQDASIRLWLENSGLFRWVGGTNTGLQRTYARQLR